MTDAEIAMLTDYIMSAPQRSVHVPGRGDPKMVDEYRVILTDEQRCFVVEAIRHYHPD